MGREVFAHSAIGAGSWHPLVEHLRATARLAARFAAVFGGEGVAWWLGLLHDVGKASRGWQDGLVRAAARGARVGIDHKTLGTQLAVDRGLGKFSVAILGHHGGLDTPRALADTLKNLDPTERERNADALQTIRALLSELADGDRVTVPDAWRSDPLVAEMALRFLFSALCDADHLDTAAHFAGRPVAVRADADMAMLRDRFEQRRRERLAERVPSAVDGIREEVYRACMAAAPAPPGVFRLAAPTGSGKTYASAGFALHHAAAHGLRRVVVAVPFLTITEQNAAEYRRLLDGEGTAEGDRVVLEHHSGVTLDSDRPEREWERLAAENWDAPFVVTTTVRLFEALFGRRPAAMRRVHRLAGAVIVLDEVQALPHDMLVPILDALRALTEQFGATVLLASATQPDFWHLSPFKTLPARDIIAKPKELARRLRRVRFEWRIDPSPTLEELAQEAAECQQAMVVVNTTKDARTVFDAWRAVLPDEIIWHLSTRMCPRHRRRVLGTVRERLAAGEPTLLVSTQLVEAGVDIDFAVVFRVLAPADSLLQAAGRANRDGKLGLEGGRVVIVDPKDAGSPPSYRLLVNTTRVHFGLGKDDLHDADALNSYYRSVYGAINLEDHRHVGQQIQAARRRFDFKAVTLGPIRVPKTGERDYQLAFRMIKDDGVAVVTPQGASTPEANQQIAALVEDLRGSARPDRQMFRDLQPYITTVYRSALRQPGVTALLRPALGAMDEPGSLVEWIGAYDQNTGITIDPRIEEYVL